MTLAPKVLIVGCGMTGSSVFHYLTRVFNLPSECFTIWEKTSDIGGRMKSTSYLGSHCDLGAQYITQSNAKYNDIYSHLISSNVFTKLAIDIDGMKPDAKLKNHYVSNQGLSAVIKQLSTNANIHTDISLDSFQTLPSGQVEVSGVSSLPHKAVVKDAYDIVVITSPSTTLTHLRSSLETIDQPGAHDLFEKFSAVGYSSR